MIVNKDITTIKKTLPFILGTAIFMQMLDSTILNTSLPSIARDLQESPLNMQNAIISYVLTLALFMPVSGFLADKFGTRRVFIVSLVLFSLGSLFCSMSQNLTELVISRVIQGVGGSLMTPVGKLALIRTFDKNELCHCTCAHRASFRSFGGWLLGRLSVLALDFYYQYSHWFIRDCPEYHVYAELQITGYRFWPQRFPDVCNGLTAAVGIFGMAR